MAQYVMLLGGAKAGFRQKKISQLHDLLVTEGGFSEREIVVFPNGVNELLLEYALNNCAEQGVERILLYICTLSQVLDSDGSVWLCGEEIRRSVIAQYAGMFGGGFQAVYDNDSELVSDEELGYEKGAAVW